MDVFGIGGRVRGTIISSGKESNIGFVEEASSCTIERAALSVDVCSGMSSAFAVSMLRDELSTVATPARSGVEQWRFRYGGRYARDVSSSGERLWSGILQDTRRSSVAPIRENRFNNAEWSQCVDT